MLDILSGLPDALMPVSLIAMMIGTRRRHSCGGHARADSNAGNGALIAIYLYDGTAHLFGHDGRHLQRFDVWRRHSGHLDADPRNTVRRRNHSGRLSSGTIGTGAICAACGVGFFCGRIRHFCAGADVIGPLAGFFRIAIWSGRIFLGRDIRSDQCFPAFGKRSGQGSCIGPDRHYRRNRGNGYDDRRGTAGIRGA